MRANGPNPARPVVARSTVPSGAACRTAPSARRHPLAAIRSGLPVLLALACAATSPARAGAHRALLIGNDAYPGASRLESCVNDAKAMSQWLLSVGFQPGEITLLTDATKARMVAALEELARTCEARPTDQVVVFYSGHGTTLHDEDGDEGPDDDTDEGLVGVFKVRSRTWSDFVLVDDEFYVYINRLAAASARVVVILDSCYSGGSMKGGLDGRKSKAISEPHMRALLEEAGVPPGPFRSEAMLRHSKATPVDAGRAALPSEVRPPPAGHALLFISSSNQYQESSSGRPTSAFTSALLRGLGPEHGCVTGPDGAVTLKGLQDYLRAALADVPQTPLLLGSGLGPDTRFQPDLFPDPQQAELAGRLAAILETLLGLPPAEQTRGDLTVRLSKPGPLAVGTRFALRVTPARDGCLVAFTVAPGGDATFLYPNRYRPTNTVAGGREVLIPFPDGLMIQPPVGIETYVVYLFDERHNPFAEFPVGKLKGPLAVGRLDDVVRRLEAKGRQVDVADLRSALDRGMTVEPVDHGAGGGKPVPDRAAGPWSRAVIKVQSIAAPGGSPRDRPE
jgi:hypothetical protein